MGRPLGTLPSVATPSAAMSSCLLTTIDPITAIDQYTLAGDLQFEHTEDNTVTTAIIANDASVSSLQFGVGLVIH